MQLEIAGASILAFVPDAPSTYNANSTRGIALAERWQLQDQYGRVVWFVTRLDDMEFDKQYPERVFLAYREAYAHFIHCLNPTPNP